MSRPYEKRSAKRDTYYKPGAIEAAQRYAEQWCWDELKGSQRERLLSTMRLAWLDGHQTTREGGV